MSWYQFRPYVSVATRRAQAAKQTAKLAKSGTILAPIHIEGRKIATTFWGKAWCENLESYSDFENRLPRGRTYVRNGSILDLQITPGRVTGLVQGSSLYKISVTIDPLPEKRWKDFVQTATGQVTNLLDLLQGKLPQALLARVSDKEAGIFPSPKEIKLKCSCPDWAIMCKHVAAVLYGVGARLDAAPELFFTLRGVDMNELLSAAGVTATSPLEAAGTVLEGEDLSALFGVEIESEAPPLPPKEPKPKKAKPSPRPKKKPTVPNKAQKAKPTRKPVKPAKPRPK
jgi:uncharacterized Zn finger protein